MHAPKPLPKADPRRFAIAVVNLEHDPDHQFEDQLVNALRTFEKDHAAQAVQILRFDRKIPDDGTEESESVGNRQGQVYLARTGAQVIIWGTVLSNQQTNAYRLCWTTSENQNVWRPKEPYKIETFKLPSVFWQHLVKILHLMVAMQSAQFFAFQGNFTVNKLRPFVEKVGNLFDGSRGQPGWDRPSVINVGLILATALETLGEQSGENEPVEHAIQVFDEVLAMTSRERRPLKWAAAQNNLGIALCSLGARKSESNYLEKAVIAHRSALQEYTRKRDPLNWAMTQNNLGLALTALAEREAGRQRLEEAVTAYRLALPVLRGESAWMIFWATTQSNLGDAIAALGRREVGTKALAEAVATYHSALRVFTPERAPLCWAITQNNLGVALADLGDRELGTKHLMEAVTALRHALQEYSREHNTQGRAMTQLNLGRVLRMLGERDSGTGYLNEALTFEQAALQEYSREKSPQNWARAKLNLAVALTALGKQEAGTKRLVLVQAEAALRAALQECPRKQMPLQWARIQSQLGDLLTVLGAREISTEETEKAGAASRFALEVYTRESNPLEWAKAQNNLADTLRDLAERKRDVRLLCEALQSHFEAWEITAGAAPYYASLAETGMINDESVLRKRFSPSACN